MTHVAEKGRELPAEEQQQTVTTPDSVQQQVVSQQTTGQEEVVTTPQVEYKYDWGSGMSMADAYNQGKHSWADIYADRRAWGKANNSPVDNFEAVMLFPRNHDVEKTKIKNEDDIKKAERKEKFDQVGNFLTHLGNFVGTVGFGGLDVKPEDPIKFTERQQRLKDKTEALRRSYNKEWFANAYKQAAAERQAEVAKATAEYKETQGKVAQQKADSQKDKDEAIIKWYNARTGQIEELTPAQYDKLVAEAERSRKQGNAAVQNANTASAREGRLAKGTTKVTTKDGESVIVENRPGTGGTDKYSKYKRSQQSDYSKYKRQK